jgi:hypothetical protein
MFHNNNHLIDVNFFLPIHQFFFVALFFFFLTCLRRHMDIQTNKQQQQSPNNFDDDVISGVPQVVNRSRWRDNIKLSSTSSLD